jgi:superfamily II DNA or RNA helicase
MSFPSATELAGHPGLIAWLADATWRGEFEPRILQAGQQLQVTSIKVTDESAVADSGPGLLCFGRVKDAAGWSTQTRLYLDSIYNGNTRRVEYVLDMDCSCLGSFACQHAVAVLETLRAIAVATPQITGSQLSPALAGWLRRIKETGAFNPAADKPARPYSKFLAYCIERQLDYHGNAQSELRFAMRIGTHTKSGFSIESRTATADPMRPVKYMADEDIAICARYHQLCRSRHQWGGMITLEGAEWDGILLPALATGRLFYGLQQSVRFSNMSYTRLAEGPALPVEAAWQILSHGEARPVLSVGDADVVLVPTEPLCYLDLTNNRFGPLHSPLPMALLRAWASGPIVPPDRIPELRRELAAVAPGNPLPLPAEGPAKVLGGLAPTPCLQITEVFTGVFLKRHIGAHLRFAYPGCPLLPPLAPGAAPQSAWFDGEARVILHRDATAEAGFREQLEGTGLLPIGRFVPVQDLTDKNRHSYVLGSLKANSADWLEFIADAACQELEAAGWRVETDPKLGLTIHDIRDFFPVLESTSEHGIDWFRFDVAGEFEGKRVSLIPQIARAIAEDWHLRYQEPATIPETLLLPCDNPADGHIRFPAVRFLEMVEQVRHLFHGGGGFTGPLRLDRLGAAGVAAAMSINATETTRALATLGRNLRDIHGLPPAAVPATIKAALRPYQLDGFRWLQFLASHGLHGILADDMGLGKTLQTLAHLAAEQAKSPGLPSLVVAPTSVVPNWAAEVAKFAPHLKLLVLHGGDRADNYEQIPAADMVLTSYPLLVRDFDELVKQHWHVLVLDEAQYIKNPKALTAISACRLKAAHRVCLSGTPLENHLGELWSLLRFLMPGFLADEKSFNAQLRKPIERDHSADAQLALNRRVAPLILRRTKDQVATELPAKTTLIHGIDLTARQADLYESVRAAMDLRVREAIAAKGIAQSHIIVLDALLKLRQICCHPQLLKSEAAQRVQESAKLAYLTTELLPTLIEEGRRILLFSQFTSMLALIEEHLQVEEIPFLKLTGQTRERAKLVNDFQTGAFPVFLISLKAGGTGLNLTAADTVIHYDPWWNPAAENQATDRAHRIGQTKPVFVHKLVCRGTIEDRIHELQEQKAALVEALLSADTSKLRIDAETLSHLLAPLG